MLRLRERWLPLSWLFAHYTRLQPELKTMPDLFKLSPESVHESGHCTIATVVGVKVLKVTLDPPCCTVDPPSLIRDRVDAYVIQLLAGQEAERLIARTDDPRRFAAQDEHQANYALYKMFRKDGIERHLYDYRQDTTALVRKHRQEIIKVACYLRALGELAGEEVTALVSAL